jgi:alpha-mannosidase
MRLSLLRSPKWPDPTADRGKHTIEYSLYPHPGKVESANTIHRGYEYTTPFIPFFTDHHDGILPAAHSFVRLEPSTLILTTIKKAEDSDAWILQAYNPTSSPTTTRITLPTIPKKVLMSSVLEDDGQIIPFEKNIVRIKTEKNALTTLKVIF